MKTSKMYLLIIMLMSMLSANAQQGRQQMSNEDRAKRLDQFIFAEVDELKKKQKEKISAANLAMVTKLGDLRQSGDREKMRDGVAEVNDSYKEEMQGILTEEQFVQFEKVMQERMQRRRQRPPQG